MKNWKLQPARDLGLGLHERPRSLQREGGLLDSIAHHAWSSIVGIYLRFFHRLSIEGCEHLPASGGFVLISNHSSHLDAMVLASAVPWYMRDRLFLIAAGDTFFSTPITGILSAFVLNALPMWRRSAGSHALAQLRDRLVREQCVYVVFPEGTRSRTGAIAPFKAGLGMMVAGTPVPVVPCRLFGAFEAFGPDRRWPRPGKVRLKIGRPIVFDQLPNEREGWQRVAAMAEAAVGELGTTI